MGPFCPNNKASGSSPQRNKRRLRVGAPRSQWVSYICLILVVFIWRPNTRDSYVRSFTPSPRYRTANQLSPPSLPSTSLMGIKGFRAWFESQFPDAIQTFNRNSEAAQDEFDHVLIDVNQLLHVALRRSRSEGHALILLIKELDACLSLAKPKKSIVLAMDGPPSAAKLATQRRRRFSTVVRTEWKKQQLSLVMERGSTSLSKREEARKRRRFATETKTLCITPGTDFMDKAHQAILYWAWQRLSNRNNPIARARIYLSPSTVPGEGEVKLLDWIFQHRISSSQSIAILGGDSDLVLEGLVIPPSITHNVFVLLPEGSKHYISISLWETTRALSRFLPKLDSMDMMRVRTDLVLLLIMNGNDYLPKLRGSAGFNNLFHNYLRILHHWLSENDTTPGSAKPFLVDPDTLEFNLPFSLAFFRRMSQLAPLNLANSSTLIKDYPRMTPLSEFNNMVDSGLMPQPVKWTVVPNNGYEDDVSEPDADNDEQSSSARSNRVMRLTLGEEGTDHYYEYESGRRSLKSSRQYLASLALEDILGDDSFSETDQDGEDMDDADDDFFGTISNVGYVWEVKQAIPGKVNTYLGGLLWNLQTYQDGICTDYAYNYGRRMSPTAREIVAFLREALDQNRNVGPSELLGDNYSPPVSAGISCLAALPSQVHGLIPDPYRQLAQDNTVEEIYGACMDPDDNVFDIKQFEKLCEKRVRQTKNHSGRGNGSKGKRNAKAKSSLDKGRRIILGDHCWTVVARTRDPLTHPFQPPAPFSDRLSKLRPNHRLKVSRVIATSEPRLRKVDSARMVRPVKAPQKRRKGSYRHEHAPKRSHSDMGPLLRSVLGDASIDKVGYKKAYSLVKDIKKNNRKKVVINLSVKVQKIERKKRRIDFDSADRMKAFQVVPVPPEPVVSIQNYTALQILQQLADSEMIGAIDVDYTLPSKSGYAAISPHDHESVQLVVRQGASETNSVLDEDLIYEQDRDVTCVSRRSLKQHLASFALCDLIGPQRRWPEMKFNDIKKYLIQQRPSAISRKA